SLLLARLLGADLDRSHVVALETNSYLIGLYLLAQISKSMASYGQQQNPLLRLFGPRRPNYQNSPDRVIYVNDPIKNQAQSFLHNSISTGKYNPFTFLFKFAYEQFSKYANLFFLFIGLIMQVPDLSPVNRFGTIVPLSIVLAATAVKEIIEDVKRHRQDAEVNARFVKTLRGSDFVPKRWREVEVGDIVRIENSDFFPADLILLSSSEPDALAYIETSNLDGLAC
ncbi:hypothetical protein HK405_001628, partial [Cladochytrium tenue]